MAAPKVMDYSALAKPDYSSLAIPSSPNDNSVYSKGGDWDLQKRLGTMASGPKIAGVPLNERILSGAQGGLPAMFGGAQNVEDTLPMVGQAFGDAAGDTVNPAVGGVAGTVGATAGQAARQGVKAMRGFRPSLGQIVAEPIRTGINELAFRGIGSQLAPTANKMMLSLAKPSSSVVESSPNLGLEILDQGVVGSKGQMIEKLGQNIKGYEGQINPILEASSGRIDAGRTVSKLNAMKPQMTLGLKANDASSVDDISQQFTSHLPTTTTTNRIPDSLGVDQNVVEKTPDMFGMNLKSANNMKKAIYAETPDSAFYRSIQENPGATGARRMVASDLRSQIGEQEPSVMPLLDKESSAIQYKNALERKIASDSGHVSFGKLPAMGAVGAVAAGHPGAGIGVLAGDAIAGTLRSGPVLSNTARALYALSKQKGLGAIARLGTSQAMRGMTDSEYN